MVELGRRKRSARCEGCGLRPDLCACGMFPTVEPRTTVIVVRHHKERHKPTNTARLLAAMVPSVQIVHYSGGLVPFDPAQLPTGTHDVRVLFPREGAVVLGEGEGEALVAPPGRASRPRAFILLDGTWHQCSRMSRRLPGVRDLPCVALPPGPPSIFRVRAQHDLRGLCTFEAAVRLWEQLEGAELVAPLRTAFETVVARMLFQKGWLDTPEVPERWETAVPRG
jgi:DTW domain-containing protein